MTRAEGIAGIVFDECGLSHPTELPISEIILGRKAFYFEKPLLGKEGEIISLEGRSVITVNSRIKFETKKRFVAAHELGHYEMHRNLIPIVFDTEYDLINWFSAGKHEIEANQFAAEFLMPSELFLGECKGKVFGPEIIDHLARVFMVSKTAAILKFVNTGNYPVCVIYCHDNKMKWWKKSSDWRYFLQFEKDTPPPSGSVASDIFTQENIYLGEDRKQEIFKSTWFTLPPDEQDNIIYEFCLYVKSYNYTLSVIWED